MSRDINFLREIIFRATSWPLTRWTASLTFPNDPSPSVFLTLYCPTRCSVLLPELVLLGGRCGAAWLEGGALDGRRSLTPERDIESSSSSKVEAIPMFLSLQLCAVFAPHWRYTWAAEAAGVISMLMLSYATHILQDP